MMKVMGYDTVYKNALLGHICKAEYLKASQKQENVGDFLTYIAGLGVEKALLVSIKCWRAVKNSESYEYNKVEAVKSFTKVWFPKVTGMNFNGEPYYSNWQCLPRDLKDHLVELLEIAGISAYGDPAWYVLGLLLRGHWSPSQIVSKLSSTFGSDHSPSNIAHYISGAFGIGSIDLCMVLGEDCPQFFHPSTLLTVANC